MAVIKPDQVPAVDAIDADDAQDAEIEQGDAPAEDGLLCSGGDPIHDQPQVVHVAYSHVLWILASPSMLYVLRLCFVYR